MFENINNATEDGKKAAKEYAESTFKYVKLKVFQQITISIGLLVKLLVIGGLFALGLIFCAVAGAFILGDYLNNMAYGYFAVAGIFFMVSLIIYIFRKSIDHKVLRVISAKFFN